MTHHIMSESHESLLQISDQVIGSHVVNSLTNGQLHLVQSIKKLMDSRSGDLYSEHYSPKKLMDSRSGDLYSEHYSPKKLMDSRSGDLYGLTFW